MHKWLFKGQIINDDAVVVDDFGKIYESDYPKNMIDGMQYIKQDQHPDITEYRVFGQILVLEDGPKLVWEKEPRSEEDKKIILDTALRNNAIAEIAELDKSLPRGLEDLIDSTVSDLTILPTIQQQKIARKKELRTILNDTSYLVNNG